MLLRKTKNVFKKMLIPNLSLSDFFVFRFFGFLVVFSVFEQTHQEFLVCDRKPKCSSEI